MTSFTNTTTNYPQNSNTPIRRVKFDTDPNTTKNFTLGDEWLNTTSGSWWKLANNPSGGLIWVIIGSSSGTTPIDSINVDASTAPGTDPVVPTSAGLVNITGAQVATGTVGANVIRTDSLAANTMTIEIQRSTAVAATDSTKNGVAHFDSAMFTVDSSGFVSLSGGQQAIDSFIPDAGTSPVVPTAAGAVTMIGGNGILTTGGTNTLTYDMQSPFDGSFVFSNSGAGSAVRCEANNSDNTDPGSHAFLQAEVGGASGGCPYFEAIIGGGGRTYIWGIDNSASGDPLKINTDTGGGGINPTTGTNIWNMTSGGNRTMALQSAFSVYLTNALTNVTGDGTTYTIVFDTTQFDANTNITLAGTTFTTPVAGKYRYTLNILLTNIDAAHTTCNLNIVTSAGLTYQCNPAAIRTATNTATISVSGIDIAGASEAITCTLLVNGGTKTVGISAGANFSYWDGSLLC